MDKKHILPGEVTRTHSQSCHACFNVVVLVLKLETTIQTKKIPRKKAVVCKQTHICATHVRSPILTCSDSPFHLLLQFYVLGVCIWSFNVLVDFCFPSPDCRRWKLWFYGCCLLYKSFLSAKGNSSWRPKDDNFSLWRHRFCYVKKNTQLIYLADWRFWKSRFVFLAKPSSFFGGKSNHRLSKKKELLMYKATLSPLPFHVIFNSKMEQRNNPL